MSKAAKKSTALPKIKADASMSDLEKLRAEIDERMKEKKREKFEIAGAVIVEMLNSQTASPAKNIVLELLASKLKKDKDRVLFGLDPLPKSKGKKKDNGGETA
ncbi:MULTISPECIES: hypothetical protein [unclassified Methylobacterium]|uniref:hypothetical protein n=1 Tax=unclassified Methylobacterium TaxID=2615210 RepID=UPI00226A5604|nr:MULTISPECIES: hypothetical protein [unclassified Methylobacterium]